MAQRLFPWTQEQDVEQNKIIELQEQARKNKGSSLSFNRIKASFEDHKSFYGLAGLFVLLLVLFFFRSPQASSPLKQQTPLVDVLVPMIAIAKGEAIVAETLKLVPVQRSLFTKSQLLQLLRPEDLPGLRGRLRAKTTLAPHKALLWSQLELQNSRALLAPPKIIYSKESP